MKYAYRHARRMQRSPRAGAGVAAVFAALLAVGLSGPTAPADAVPQDRATQVDSQHNADNGASSASEAPARDDGVDIPASRQESTGAEETAAPVASSAPSETASSETNPPAESTENNDSESLNPEGDSGASNASSSTESSTEQSFLTVHASTADGAPISGVEFELWRETNDAAGLQQSGTSDTTDTDWTCATGADGNCTVGEAGGQPTLAPGTYYWAQTDAPEAYVTPAAADQQVATAEITAASAGTNLPEATVIVAAAPDEPETPELGESSSSNSSSSAGRDSTAGSTPAASPSNEAPGGQQAAPDAGSITTLAASGDWYLEKSTDPSNGETVAPGETITYTLTAANYDWRDSVTGATVTDDLTDVLDDAKLVTPLASGLTFDDSTDTLTWNVPAIPDRDRGGPSDQSVQYQVVVDDDAADGATLANTASPDSSGSCQGWQGGPCETEQTVDIPEPATITVHAGGVRTGTSTVAPLPDGAVFQAIPDTNNTPAGGPWECTISGGTCSIMVPGGDDDYSGDSYSWDVSLKTPPVGWFGNGQLDLGNNAALTATDYAFETDELASGETVDVPGANPDGKYWDGNYHRFTGLLAASLNNPSVPQQCGLDMALVLDQSGSMNDDSKQDNLQSAANAAIDALTGTPSTMAIYTFGPNADGDVEQAQTSTATATEAQALHDFINALPTPNDGTNWDEGLYQVADAAGNYDLVVFVTDGAPTTDHDGNGGGTDTRFDNISNAIFSANAVKQAGTPIVALGIGIDGAAENLIAVSGQNQGTDYYLGSSSDFGQTLQELAAGGCQGTVTIHKKIEDWQGNDVPNSPDANGWQFTGSISQGSTIGTFAPTATVNDVTGYTNTDVTIAQGSNPTITLTEEQQDGYTLTDVTCTVDGQDVAETISDTSVSFPVTAGPDSSIACTFTNQQPRPAHVLTVEKTWQNAVGTDTAVLTIGDATKETPAYRVAQAPDDGDGASPQSATKTVPVGQTVTIDEAAPASNTGTYTSALSCPGVSGSSDGTFTMPDEDVTCTFTNTRVTTSVTLVKQWVHGVEGDSTELTIDAPGADDPTAVSTVTGAGAARANGWTDTSHQATEPQVPVGATVTVGEVLDQADNTGVYDATVACTTPVPGGGSEPVTVTNGTFTVPAGGADCAITNVRVSAQVTIQKTWVNGANGDEATLRVVGYQDSAITSASNGAAGSWTDPQTSTTTVWIGADTHVSETFPPDANTGEYDPSLACTDASGGEVSIREDDDTDAFGGYFTMPAEDVTCTFTNTRTSATVTLVKEWVDGVQGDQAHLSIASGGSPVATSTSIANGDSGTWVDTGHSASASAPSGAEVTVSEELDGQNHGAYATELACRAGQDGSAVSVSEGTFTMPEEDVTCTVTNTLLVPAITIEKQAWDVAQADPSWGDTGDITAPEIPAGSDVVSGNALTWTYTVTNTGETTLQNIVVTDDVLGHSSGSSPAITCPSTTLAVGESMLCTASGSVTAQ